MARKVKWAQAAYNIKNPEKYAGIIIDYLINKSLWETTFMKCHICEEEFENNRKWSKHFRDRHNINSKDYYDTYIKQNGNGECKHCGSNTYFRNVVHGYSQSCINCQSINTTLWRAKNAKDPVKHKQFVEKVKENQTAIWKKRKKNGSDKIIREKISTTMQINNALLSDEERKERFGWQNKLSSKDLENWKQDVMFKTGIHNNDPVLKQKMINKGTASRLNMSIEDYENSRNNETDQQLYNRLVDNYTHKSYVENKLLLDPDNKRSKEYHLDHKFSKIKGYMENIDPSIIGSVHNLELVSSYINLSKSGKCSITIDELMEAYDGENT